MDNNETRAIRRELAALNRKLDGIADIINQDVRVPDRLSRYARHLNFSTARSIVCASTSTKDVSRQRK